MERSVVIKLLKFLTVFAVGGTERQFVHVTRSLDRSRFELYVGCLAKSGALLKDIEALNVPISEYKTKSLGSYRTLIEQVRLAREIRRRGIRLVHAYGFYPNVFTVPAAKLAGKCVAVASVRDTGIFSTHRGLKRLAQRFVCWLADCVVANSNAVRDSLIQQGISSDRIRVIRNGIVVSPERPIDDFPIRRELGIDPDAPVIAAITRLDPIKGLEYLLQAAGLVIKEVPAARFLIVGDACFDPVYKTHLHDQAARLNLKEHVIFTGQRTDVTDLLREVTLSVLPSLSEGFSNALLEAMAAGLPVVATNVGGNPEIVREGETGLLVPPRDPEALSQAIIQVLRSPDLARRMGQAGRDRVVQNFSLESTVRQTEQLYMTLLEQRKLLSAA